MINLWMGTLFGNLCRTQKCGKNSKGKQTPFISDLYQTTFKMKGNLINHIQRSHTSNSGKKEREIGGSDRVLRR